MDTSHLDPDLAALLEDIPSAPSKTPSVPSDLADLLADVPTPTANTASPDPDITALLADIPAAPVNPFAVSAHTDAIDPDLAALLADVPTGSSNDHFDGLADISDDILFQSSPTALGETGTHPGRVDLTVSCFPKIEKFYNDTPHTYFDSPEYYKRVLKNCGSESERFHAVLSKYLTAQDPKDRTIYRQQLLTNYWQFLSVLVGRLSHDEAALEKKYALRYGLILPTLLTAEQKHLFSRVIEENSYNEPVYYLDEWFHAIAVGQVTPSSTDEVRIRQKDASEHSQQLYNKASGKLESAENLLRAKSEARSNAEETIKMRLNELFMHDDLDGFHGVKAPFTELQKRGINEVSEALRNVLVLDRELASFYNEHRRVEEDVRLLREKVESSAGAADLNVSGVAAELDTIRQMAKMTCGRQGNHFPVLSREFFRCTENEVGIRENVLNIMRWIESIDKEAYCRYYRSQVNRIPPFVILIPSYGDIGFCWEPFDRYNRVTSRGRIGIPMYTKNLKVALLTATADLRWQVAKEKASYYWMEEGLTGNYYQWFQGQKLKGDVKEYFIEDYLIWMTKESEGIQKLDREVRNVFWRFMPFAKEVKEELKMRAPVYQELYQKDLNRQMSDGY